MACSSDAGVDEDEDPSLDAGGPEDDATVDSSSRRDARPDRSETGSDASNGGDAKDAGGDAKDSGTKDAGDASMDAPFAETGTPCSPVSTIQTRKCGLCGQQHRVCLDPDDAGNPVWQEWGYCLGQVDGGCMPGDIRDAGCGKCGTVTQTCPNSCMWPAITDESSKCKDQGPCYGGDMEFVLGLSCGAGLGRNRSCNDECNWEAFEDCEPPPTAILVPTTVGDRIGQRVKLGMNPPPGHFSPENRTCTDQYWSQWSSYAYALVELKNATPTDAVVSVWTFPANPPGAISAMDVTLRALRARPNIPPGGIDAGYDGTGLLDCTPDWTSTCCEDTTLDRSACRGGCAASPRWGGLLDSENHGVMIPANSSVWLFVQNVGDSTGGDLMIGVKRH